LIARGCVSHSHHHHYHYHQSIIIIITIITIIMHFKLQVTIKTTTAGTNPPAGGRVYEALEPDFIYGSFNPTFREGTINYTQVRGPACYLTCHCLLGVCRTKPVLSYAPDLHFL